MLHSVGHVDGLIGRYVNGWAAPKLGDGDSGLLQSSCCLIEVYDEQATRIGSGRASRDRDDLRGLNLGRVDFGFRVPIDQFGTSNFIRVYADGHELPGSPLEVGEHVLDGFIDLSADRAFGWVCRRGLPADRIDIVIQTADCKATVSAVAKLPNNSGDPMFQPCSFDVQLPQRFFDRSDLHVQLVGQGRVISSVRGALSFRGFLDAIAPDHIVGWLLSPEAPARDLEVEAYLDGALVATAKCVEPRSDLRERYPDNWRRGFVMHANFAASCTTHLSTLSLRLAGTDTELFDGPFVVGDRTAFVAAAKRVSALVRNDALKQGAADAAAAQDMLGLYLGKVRKETGFMARPLAPRAVAKPERPISILVPIYKGVALTEACVSSALAECGDDDTVVLIADFPPEPEMLPMLRRMAHNKNVVLLENDANIGFVRSVNRGIGYVKSDDVLLLNSDTYLFPGALSALRKALHSADNIASATAISNNATIFSYPHPSKAIDRLEDISWRRLAEIALEANHGKLVDVPTGHGFCMLVRREVLDALKQLNEVFGRGYGEENELCLRASDLGYRHVAAIDAFVEHRESVSFGTEKANLISNNLAVLGTMFPEYTPTIMEFESTDPLRSARWALDIARFRQAREGGSRFVLVVENSLGGGTAKAAREIGRLVGYGNRTQLTLRCFGNGAMELSCSNPLVKAVFSGSESSQVIAMLDASGADLVIFHQLLGFTVDSIASFASWAADKKSFAFGHDFYPACPRTTFIDAAGDFCGGQSDDVCRRCLDVGGAHEASRTSHLDINEHRTLYGSFLASMDAVITPSRDTRDRLSRYFPAVNFVAIPHPADEQLIYRPIRSGRSNKVVVLGAIGPHKGSAQLHLIASRARISHPHLVFSVVGYTDIDEKLLSLGNVEILGSYTAETLPALIDTVGARLALFLNCWPETFSYTLSEAVCVGLVPIVPNIGAPSERVRDAGLGLIVSFPPDPAEVLASIENFDYDAVSPSDAAGRFISTGSAGLLQEMFGV
jgi:GT2 family glycosyltransferase/glycosyltransferase involved in cell wall biosynthesis